MNYPKAQAMLDFLESDSYKKRLQRTHRFEEISGGGVVKQLERLFISPDIYIPYVIYAKLGLSRIFFTSMTLFWGRRIQIPLRDYDALILSMYGGLYGSELKLTKFLIRNLGPEDVLYDVGANFGFYTYLGTELCKQTHTFEPMTELTAVVKRNVPKDGSAFVNSVALSDVNGSLDFYVMESTMVNTLNAAVAEKIATHFKSPTRKITVPTMTLDTYLATHEKPTFLKIDVEGAEERVIDGGKEFFSTHSPTVAIEIWGKDNKWELSMSAAEKLRKLGYESYRINDDGLLEKADGDLSAELLPNGGGNYIFKKS